MENGWFVLTHKYSMSRDYDPEGVGRFRADLDIAMRLHARCVVLESYPRDFAYGDYLTPWCVDTLRAMVDAAHQAGLKIIPYTNATEVDIKSSVYTRRRDWLARPPLGAEYSAFISCFLPEYFKEGDFFNKLVCPAGPWRQYYLDQCDGLMERFGFDGIYVDRVDYRVPCVEHPGFTRAIPEMISDLSHRIKMRGKDNILVVNDSCKIPDRTFRRTMQSADIVLTEILPPGTIQELSNLVTFMTSGLLHAVKPVTQFAVSAMMNGWARSPIPDRGRIERRVKMLDRVTGRPVWIFTHALSSRGAFNAWNAAEALGHGVCIFSPRPLAESDNILKLLHAVEKYSGCQKNVPLYHS